MSHPAKNRPAASRRWLELHLVDQVSRHRAAAERARAYTTQPRAGALLAEIHERAAGLYDEALRTLRGEGEVRSAAE